MSLGDEGKEAGGCGGGFVRSGAWALLSRDKHRGTGDFRWTGLPGNRSLFGQKDFSLPHSFRSGSGIAVLRNSTGDAWHHHGGLLEEMSHGMKIYCQGRTGCC